MQHAGHHQRRRVLRDRRRTRDRDRKATCTRFEANTRTYARQASRVRVYREIHSGKFYFRKSTIENKSANT